jgi:hypothetical protein
VQANHIAPQGAKYSKENVKKEKELSRVSFVSFFLSSEGFVKMAKEDWINFLGNTGSRRVDIAGSTDLRIYG